MPVSALAQIADIELILKLNWQTLPYSTHISKTIQAQL
jgi:hypothetical protein